MLDLTEITARAERLGVFSDERGKVAGDVAALVAEVERLRTRVAELEDAPGEEETAKVVTHCAVHATFTPDCFYCARASSTSSSSRVRPPRSECEMTTAGPLHDVPTKESTSTEHPNPFPVSGYLGVHDSDTDVERLAAVAARVPTERDAFVAALRAGSRPCRGGDPRHPHMFEPDHTDRHVCSVCGKTLPASIPA